MKCRAVEYASVRLRLLVGCGPTLQVKTDFDHGATFGQYRSFQMGEGKVIEQGALTENTIVKDRVDVAVRRPGDARPGAGVPITPI